MNAFFLKTFGGITKKFYWRQFFFGLFFYLTTIYSLFNEPLKTPFLFTALLVYLTISQILYPYSRFVYHSITDFILGDNVYIISLWILLPFRLLMAFLCWSFSIFIAPVGLIYLYFYHSTKKQ